MSKRPMVTLAAFVRMIANALPEKAKPEHDRDVWAMFLGAWTALEAEHGTDHPLVAVFRDAAIRVRHGGRSSLEAMRQELSPSPSATDLQQQPLGEDALPSPKV